MKTFCVTREAADLYIQGQLAFAECEKNGIRVDKGRLEATIKKVKKQIVRLEEELENDRVVRKWRKVYGDKTNLGSRTQLADILFNKLGIKSGGITGRSRRDSTDKSVLEQIDIPFIKKYLRLEPMKKSLSTNLIGVQRMLIERNGMWFIHPDFSLNLTRTTRSSSSGPNWQNFPKRDEEIRSLVRPIFITRPGRRFGDPDLGQIEVRVPAAITGDRELNRYIHDPKSDMHKDQACEVWLLKPSCNWKSKELKAIRQTTKTNHVFAGFYGSPYYNTAKRLWDDIERYKLKLDDGMPLKKHLKRKGITELGECDPNVEPRNGTFVRHMQKCEKKLWQRFSGYRDWRESQIEQYRKNGGMMMVTGVAVTGIMSRTQIGNYGIQGPAFHGLLWIMIELIKWLKKHKMKSLVLGEIHDSIQLEIVEKELQDILDKIESLVTKELPKAWPWISKVPLTVEMDVSPRNGSWADCEVWERNESGIWVPPLKA